MNEEKIMKKILIALCMLSNMVFAQTVPDYAKEARWAEQVEDGIMDGDVVWLAANNHDFMSIFTPSEVEVNQTAIIVHGLGVHPDWPQVIQPLRVALTTQGFNTLSIQMPVLDNEAHSGAYQAVFGQADQRIQAAVEYLQKNDLLADVLVAHSLGSVMSTHYLANYPHPFKRFVGVGMPGDNADYLPKLSIPILDLYGDQDIESVLNSVEARAQAAKGNNNYTQIVVSADHFFNEKDELLINTVNAWLN